MISTAFAAVPKETVGSASFIAVTTQIAEDGTWEVTFDTSNLNVDEYSLKVACGDKTWKNVEINVVEAADEPVTPPTDEPGQDHSAHAAYSVTYYNVVTLVKSSVLNENCCDGTPSAVKL